MTKELSNVMLELLHTKMKPSNVRKKKKELSNVTKKLSNVMLKLGVFTKLQKLHQNHP